MPKNLLNQSIFRLYMTNLVMSIILLLSVSSLEESKIQYIYKQNDILLFLTKDGYLTSYKNDNDVNINQNWKIYFGEFISFSKSNKITKDISIYMINDKPYIIKDNILISYNLFVYDLVNNNNYVHIQENNDYFLKGNIEYNYHIIDINSGKILQTINNNNNDPCVLKKLNKTEKTIVFKKEEYNLQKIDKNTKKTLMNISISDVQILKSKIENENYIYLDEQENLEKFLKDLKLKIEKDEIISIYSYSDKDRKLNILYNKDIFDNSAKKSSDEKDIKELIKENNSILKKLFKYDIFNTILVIGSTTILIFLFKLFPKAQTANFNNINIINKNYTNPNEALTNSTTIIANNNNNDNLYQVCPKVEIVSINPVNDIQINEKENNQLVKYKPNEILDIMKNKKKHFYKQDLYHCHSSTDLAENKNTQFEDYQNDINDINIIDKNNFEIMKK